MVVGAIGSVGEAFMLRHELTDCLPYKVVDYQTYSAIGSTGLWLIPLLAVVPAALFLRRTVWIPVVAPVVLSPILFATVFKMMSATRGLDALLDPSAPGDFTVSKAADQFYAYCVSLTIAGAIIGSMCALAIVFLTKSRKLP